MNQALNFFRGSEKPGTCASPKNLADDQLAALVVQGMLPMWKEKLLGQEFDNLG